MPSSIEHVGHHKKIFRKIKSFVSPIFRGNRGTKLLEEAKEQRRKGDLKQTQVILERILEDDPLSVPALTELGLVLEISARYQEAINYLTKAKNLSPKDPFPRIYLTRVLTAKRLYDEAKLERLELSKLMSNNSPAKAMVLYARLLRNIGNYTEALKWAEQSLKSGGGTEATEIVQLVSGDINVYKKSVRPKVNFSGRYIKDGEDKIFHLLEDSQPYKNSGYTIRSSYILKRLRAMGLNIFTATKPGVGRLSELTLEEYREEQYYRLPLNGHHNYNMHPLDKYLENYADYVLQIALAERPSIIHAASNFKNGIVANSIARALKIPWVYEARGIWEASQVAVGAIDINSERYQFFQNLEIESMLSADAVITISATLKSYFVELGIPENKIFVVPNGVDTNAFPILKEADKDLLSKYDLKDSLVVGYIGSLSHYEGIELLVKSFINAFKDNPKVKLLIVGDGDSFNAIEQLASQSEISDRIILTGRVPHDQILPYYSILDLFVLPRLPLEVCKKVTPLKPFEAMSTGRALLVSDVNALKEMVVDGETGFHFKAGDKEHLSLMLKNLIEESELRRNVASQAANWVRKNRTWEKTTLGYKEAYSLAMSSVN